MDNRPTNSFVMSYTLHTASITSQRTYVPKAGDIKVGYSMLDPDFMRFRYDPLVGIAIFQLEIKSQIDYRGGAVRWLTAKQEAIPKLN